MSSIIYIALLLAIAEFAAWHALSCRCLPSDSCWPDDQAWTDFNNSVDGKLIAVLPPAAPCHDPYFDEQACQAARQRWAYPFWRADQPGAMQIINWESGCWISGNRTSECSQGDVPFYAVNVSQVSQVQKTIQFAANNSLRVVVKGTGHDSFGRSTAAGSLSIWLHHLKHIEFHEDFVPDCCQVESLGAVTVGGGSQWEEVAREAYERKLTIVGGAVSSVGAAGGYVQGGGHSAVSPEFGLAADNVLQYQVVTADGKLRIANTCQNSNLFWALRGGGGGTFAVVVAATYKSHPALSNLVFASYDFYSNNSRIYQLLIRTFIRINPYLSDVGWSGYFYGYYAGTNTMSLAYLLANRNMSVASLSILPFISFAQQLGVQVSGSLQSFASLQDWHLQIQCGGQPTCIDLPNGAVGHPDAVASRLIPRHIFENETTVSYLSEVFMKIISKVGIIGHLVAGGAVARARNNAVNPAWRNALWHFLVYANWAENATESVKQERAESLTAANKLVIDLTPGSGCYVNEADINEPNWQQSFFGKHYKRLHKIKQHVDPYGLFVCWHCVGSEDWSEDLNCRVEQPAT